MNPFKEIWFNTGKCIDYFLIEKNRKRYIKELIWIQALVVGILSYLNNKLGEEYILVALFALPGLAILSLRFILPWVFLMAGKLMNGQGSMDDLRTILSLSCIPYLLNLFYLILALFIPGIHESNYGPIDWIVWICVWRIMIIGIAKVQRISYEFALMNILIPMLPILVLYLVIKY